MLEHRIASLEKALQFLDVCRADPNSGPTGALKDAHYWLEEAAREVVRVHVSEVGRLQLELSEAYAEFRKIRPAVTAIFDRAVWDRATNHDK